jgi:phosphoglycerate dehydrogenase-like enzyme
MAAHTLLFVSDPAAPHLRHLAALPDATRIVVGNSPEAFSDEACAAADVAVIGVGGRATFEAIFPRLRRVRWFHSMPAGLDNLLFPALVASPVPLTNSRGVFAPSLGEFAVTGMLYFAKNLARMRAQQQAGLWQAFEVDELRGQTLAIVGFGEIGRHAALRAKPFGMRIHALRRRPELSQADPLVDRNFAPAQLDEMLAGADYLLVAAALTPATRGMIGAAQLALLPRHVVVLNLGRGPVIVEADLIDALRARRIRGAVLDVFDIEPLPAGHAFYELDNVLLSPHCADNTRTWLDEAMRFFLDNFARFDAGQPLLNVTDKNQGY